MAQITRCGAVSLPTRRNRVGKLLVGWIGRMCRIGRFEQIGRIGRFSPPETARASRGTAGRTGLGADRSGDGAGWLVERRMK